MSKKALIIVELDSLINELITYRGLYDLFSRFTLPDMIEQILSIDPYIDYSQHVYDAIECRFDDDEYTVNMELFTCLFDSIIQQVDEAVQYQYKDVIDHLEHREGQKAVWLFQRWVGATAVLIRLEV